MIVVDLIGRLGNQMFQYAFALNTAKKLKTLFIFNPVYTNELTVYFKLDKGTCFLYSNFGIKLNRILLQKKEKYKVINQNGWQSNVRIENNVHYKGFFQSELFFEQNKKKLRRIFSIKQYWIDKFINKYGDIYSKNKVLVIHIRRTDYQDFGSDELGGKNLCLPMTYYLNCLNKLGRIDAYTVICISDDIEFAKEHLKCKNNILFESNEAIIDFQLMLNADALIIANSTFAWWAAYLNDKPNKIVYSPKYWLGFKKDVEYPSGITVSEFSPMEVY